MSLSFFLRALFICISVVLIIVLCFLTRYMYKKQNEYRRYIAAQVGVGIFSIIAYSLFLLSTGHRQAVFFDSVYFVGTDWLAMLMLVFAIAYTKVCEKYIKKITVIFSILCAVDSVSLLVNNIWFHMFDLVEMVSFKGVTYWGNSFGFLHYCHLFLCYVMVGWTFIALIVSCYTSPSYYKEKYLGILISYIIVIVANFVCYSVNLPFDISVILYAVLAGFICYYATYAYPVRLLHKILNSISENVSDAILYFDIEGSFVYANKSAQKLFVNRTSGDFDVKEAEAYHRKYYAGAAEGTDSFTVEGREYYYRVECCKEYFNEVEVGSYVRMIDVTAEIERYRMERENSIRDSLTGVYNRVGFFEAVDEFISINGTKGYLMVCSNIKDFKLINKLFGDSVGDGVLKTQAELFKKYSHKDSIYGRVGDDKFALFVSKSTFSEDELIRCINILQESTEKSIYHLSVAAGIYDPEGRKESAQSMCDKTILAINQIRDDYVTTFSYYDSSLMDKILYEKNITEDFSEAIENKQVQMYLQPIVDENKNWVGAEALCRWNHPFRGVLLPEDFLPVLEKNGLIFKLDEFIWDNAFKTLSRWNNKGYKKLYISVNISVKDFFYADVYKILTEMADRYDVDPQSLHIEVTETVLMSDFAKAYILASRLQKFGFNVAIDNFGNGYSSLNMLKDYKAEILKIDRVFLRNAEEDSRGQVILEAIMKMAKSLEMDVIGEGVEDVSQFNVLKNLGCDYYQGHLFAEPLDIDTFEMSIFKDN